MELFLWPLSLELVTVVLKSGTNKKEVELRCGFREVVKVFINLVYHFNKLHSILFHWGFRILDVRT